MSFPCPACKTTLPDRAMYCDCGHVFEQGALRPTVHHVQDQQGIPVKTCPHCRMNIPKEAQICAFCRQAVGAEQATAQLIGAVITIGVMLWGLYYWWQATEAANGILQQIKR